mgnify:CR=1 FL=1|tara:strand:- start:3415 stop:4224 length:810 start_codon:yes stop_codon:yes gene_type:complete
MRNLAKFIFFLIKSLFEKKHRFILFTPDLTIFKYNKVFLFDKKKGKFISQIIRDKYDYITIVENYFYQCYDLENFDIYKIIKKDIETKNSLIVDCGSNIGCSTNFFLETYGNSKIISIEPDKENFQVLKRNVNSSRVQLINNAVSNEIIHFKVSSNTLHADDNRGKNIVEVNDTSFPKSITINDILSDKLNVNLYPLLIKIDIEGFENNLFEKNVEWMDKFKILIVELHDWMLPKKSISKNYFNAICRSMEKNDRDILIKGENIISIKI